MATACGQWSNTWIMFRTMKLPELNIPTGIPLVYELDADLKPVTHYYLADEETVRKAAEAVAAQGKVK